MNVVDSRVCVAGLVFLSYELFVCLHVFLFAMRARAAFPRLGAALLAAARADLLDTFFFVEEMGKASWEIDVGRPACFESIEGPCPSYNRTIYPALKKQNKKQKTTCFSSSLSSLFLRFPYHFFISIPFFVRSS